MLASRRPERGVAAAVVVLTIAALLGVVGLALNVGYRLDVRSELQNAADSAALAGARELNGTLAPITAALPQTEAISFAGRHTSGASVPVTITGGDVQLGHWDPFTTNPDTAFTPITATDAESAWNTNAVRVRDGREANRGSAVSVWFSAFLGGRTTQDVAAEAVAVNGGPCDLFCPTMPFAFFDCGFFQNYNLECGTIVHMTGTTAPDPTDTVGFSSLSLDPASTSTYRRILSGDTCSDYAVASGDPIEISNGSQLNALCSDLQARIGQTATAPIVHDTCPPRFNQAHPVVGVATFRIVDVVCTGGTKRIDFEFLCNQTVQTTDRIGCGFYGTGPLQPDLVR